MARVTFECEIKTQILKTGITVWWTISFLGEAVKCLIASPIINIK